MIGKLGSQQQIQQAQIQETDSSLENAKQPAESPQQDSAAKAQSHSATQTGDYIMSGQLSRMLLDRLLTDKTEAQAPQNTEGFSQGTSGKPGDPAVCPDPVVVVVPLPQPPVFVPVPIPMPMPVPGSSGHVDPEYPVTPHDEPSVHVDPEYPVKPNDGPGPAKRTYAGPNDTLQQGSLGPEVSKLQKELNTWRAENGKEPIAVDGNFGPKTDAALREFQTANFLANDGLAGPNTKAQLELNSLPLPSVTKTAAQNQLLEYQNNPVARENLMKELKDPNFQMLSEMSQWYALDALKTNPSDATHAKNIHAATNEMRKLESTPEFLKMDYDGQNFARNDLFRFADRPAGAYNISGLVTDPGFSKLEPESQTRILKTINSANDPDLAPSYRSILNSKAFEGMDDDMRRYVLVLAESNSKDPDAMSQLGAVMNDPQLATASKEEQLRQLKPFEKEPEPDIVR